MSTPIRDESQAARGEPKMLRLCCDRCGRQFAIYQKDGEGPLKRMYLDRVHEPAELRAMATGPLEALPEVFRCQCGEEIGVRMLYGKAALGNRMTHSTENRFAIRLFQATLKEEVIS